MRFIAPAGKWIPREEAVNRVRPEIRSSSKRGTFVRDPLPGSGSYANESFTREISWHTAFCRSDSVRLFAAGTLEDHGDSLVKRLVPDTAHGTNSTRRKIVSTGC